MILPTSSSLHSAAFICSFHVWLGQFAPYLVSTFCKLHVDSLIEARPDFKVPRATQLLLPREVLLERPGIDNDLSAYPGCKETQMAASRHVNLITYKCTFLSQPGKVRVTLPSHNLLHLPYLKIRSSRSPTCRNTSTS